MARLRKRARKAWAELVAETGDGLGLAVRLDKPPLPFDGLRRDVLAYAAPGVPSAAFARLLRELATLAESSPEEA